MQATRPTPERTVAASTVVKVLQLVCTRVTAASRTPHLVLPSTKEAPPPPHTRAVPAHPAHSAFVEHAIALAMQRVLGSGATAEHRSPVDATTVPTPTSPPSSPPTTQPPSEGGDSTTQPTTRAGNAAAEEPPLRKPEAPPRDGGPSSARRSQKRSAPSPLSSAVSLFEASDAPNGEFDTHVPNVITELAIYSVVQNVPPSLPTPRRIKPKKQVLPPVVVPDAAPAAPQPALSQRTKVAAEVYLPGSSDSIVVARPHHHHHQSTPLEPLVFKGGKYKPYLHEAASKATNSPRIKKLEQQYGAALPSPKRPASNVPTKSSAASQVSGFCRQCLLVGDMCKLADCREHNYFPPLKPPAHHQGGPK